jgi:RimJ/RimL family protein N-acetyltransferase
MEKAGMTYEGTLREREFINGAYQDIEFYSILRCEYRWA